MTCSGMQTPLCSQFGWKTFRGKKILLWKPMFSSGLWGTITGISSKVCPSAPVGRARLCLWCGTRWPHTGCMFSVRAGTTSVMTGTGRPTGAPGIIQVTWQTWLSLMEVSSCKRCLWAWKGPLSLVPAHVVAWLKQWGTFIWLVGWLIFYLLFCLDGNAHRWDTHSPEDHSPSSPYTSSHPNSSLCCIHGLHLFTGPAFEDIENFDPV